MNSIANIVGPIYQSLLKLCEREGIALNLDLTHPSRKVRQENLLREFLKTSMTLAVKNCRKGNKITLVQTVADNHLVFSLKYDGALLDDATKTKLDEQGYAHRSRFGYGNTISVQLN